MLKIIKERDWLKPFEKDIELRMANYEQTRRRLLSAGQTLNDFANAHNYYGFHFLKPGSSNITDTDINTNGVWVYREWAPAADELYLTGDFNNWQWLSHPLTRIPNTAGDWIITLPGDVLFQGSRVKTIVRNGDKLTEHIPLYAKRAVQDSNTNSWCCEIWDPAEKYPWTDKDFKAEDLLYIYEAHIGMAQDFQGIGSYIQFADNILPRIKEDGYNTVQLMAVMEHPYYASFGYQVSSFYAASSRFGYPDELKYLINKAHEMGLCVLLDLIHSHAAKNTLEGINLFDGTAEQFFLSGTEGEHKAWDTKCFNYEKPEVIHFLLSNLKFWMEEYHFDGFRFDGVTSMLYHDHSLGTSFDNLNKYFSMNTNTHAVTYLQLANELIREVNPDAITIAEDMSGMPGMCVPVKDGGIGFDYRLGMGLPDMFIRLTKDIRDENWNMDWIWSELSGRLEPTIAYLESHDQALVGDKTIMFRLADSAMYTEMMKDTHSYIIDRAIALHKMLRLLVMAAGGDGYLNFMGNEFGHPEWIDFPREGNDWSYYYCRRQWHLADDESLKYRWLGDFDKAIVELTKKHRIFDQQFPDLKWIRNDDHVIAFERGDLLFIFNFYPTISYDGYEIPVTGATDPSEVDFLKYEAILSTDDFCYGGFGHVYHQTYEITAKPADTKTRGKDPGDESRARASETTSKGRSNAKVKGILTIYLPARTAVVLKKIEK